jgi:hypothetical protein
VKQLSLLYQGDTPQLEWKQVLQRNILYGLQEIPELIKTEVLEEPENVDKVRASYRTFHVFRSFGDDPKLTILSNFASLTAGNRIFHWNRY